jgi:hypothetical protein
MNPQECPFRYGTADHADGAFGTTIRRAITTTAPSSMISIKMSCPLMTL